MSDQDILYPYKFVPSKDFVPNEGGTDIDIHNWTAVIEDEIKIGVVNGYLIDDDNGIHYVSVLLKNEYSKDQPGNHIIFPHEEMWKNVHKKEVLLASLNPGFLDIYPVYTPGDQVTIEMEKKIRQFFTSGFSSSLRLRNVIRGGRRTTMRHGPLSGDRQFD
jgi:hypothetical protein